MAAASGNANGRVALITGGMGGLGETIATKMVDAGYKVVVTYSPGNTKYKEWVAGMPSTYRRTPRMPNVERAPKPRTEIWTSWA